jgi:hypothetical protein
MMVSLSFVTQSVWLFHVKPFIYRGFVCVTLSFRKLLFLPFSSPESPQPINRLAAGGGTLAGLRVPGSRRSREGVRREKLQRVFLVCP